MKAFCSPSCSLVHERKLPAVANQNSRKNRQKRLTDKKSLYIFLQKSDVTEHEGEGTATRRCTVNSVGYISQTKIKILKSEMIVK